MNNKKYNKLMRTGIVLTGISVSMFTYQNLIYPNYIESKILVPVYTASRDIKPGEKISRDMFSTTQIRESDLIEGMITDIDSYLNTHTKGTLFKGEILTEYRVDKKQQDVSQIFQIKFDSEFVADVKSGDFIAVYVRVETEDDRLVIRELFPRKEVYIGEYANDNKSKVDTSLYITASEQEMKDYYLALKKGQIIGVKIISHDVPVVEEDIKDTDISTNINADINTDINTSINTEQETVSDTQNENTSASLESLLQNSVTTPDSVTTPETQVGGIVEYEVQSGDTLESLVIKFKTSEDRIKSLNNNKTIFNAGEIIYVPAY